MACGPSAVLLLYEFVTLGESPRVISSRSLCGLSVLTLFSAQFVSASLFPLSYEQEGPWGQGREWTLTATAMAELCANVAEGVLRETSQPSARHWSSF